MNKNFFLSVPFVDHIFIKSLLTVEVTGIICKLKCNQC